LGLPVEGVETDIGLASTEELSRDAPLGEVEVVVYVICVPLHKHQSLNIENELFATRGFERTKWVV
jgi:hypothetical protein